MAEEEAKEQAKGEIDEAAFDRIMTLAYAFEENKKLAPELKVPWEQIKPVIEMLSGQELEILLGMVKDKG